MPDQTPDKTVSESQYREFTTSLSSAIRRRRISVGFNLRLMSERTGMSLGHISQIELGQSMPSMEALYRLCVALELTMAQLFSLVEVQADLIRIEHAALNQKHEVV